MNVLKLAARVKKCIKPLYNGGKYLRYNIEGLGASQGIYLSENEKRLAAYKNKHKGERCFLIGTGPSLKASDLELIKNEYSIGCNMIYKIFEETSWRPTYHCVTDRNYGLQLAEEISKQIQVPFFTPKSTYVRMNERPKYTIYVNDVYTEGAYRVKGDMLSYCNVKATVMGFMLELAMYMGFSEIYLLGVDCTSSFQNTGHFTKNYIPEKLKQDNVKRLQKGLKGKNISQEEAACKSINRSIEVYEKIELYAQKKGLSKIYNATRGGALEVFERTSLEEVLR